LEDKDKKVTLKNLDGTDYFTGTDYVGKIEEKDGEKIVRCPDGGFFTINENGELKGSESCASGGFGTSEKSSPSNNRLGKEGPKASPVFPRNKTGRNQTCPCKSGKKYKNCCIGKQMKL